MRVTSEVLHKSEALGSLPSRNLAAISQADAALTKMPFSCWVMIFLQDLGSAGSPKQRVGIQ